MRCSKTDEPVNAWTTVVLVCFALFCVLCRYRIIWCFFDMNRRRKKITQEGINNTQPCEKGTDRPQKDPIRALKTRSVRLLQVRTKYVRTVVAMVYGTYNGRLLLSVTVRTLAGTKESYVKYRGCTGYSSSRACRARKYDKKRIQVRERDTQRR